MYATASGSCARFVAIRSTAFPSISPRLFYDASQLFPTLIHADKKGWNELASMKIDTVSEDVGLKRITDMFILQLLHDVFTKEEMDVTLWMNNYSYGFPYNASEDDKEGPQIDCEMADKIGAHLSHYTVRELAEEEKNYPKIEGMKDQEGMQKRAEAAVIMLNDYRDKCKKKVP